MKLYWIPTKHILEMDEADRLTALRINVLYMITQAGAGHLGTSLSSLEVMYHVLMIEARPDDIFFSSKGHDAAALYAVLMLKGVLPEHYLHNFRRLGGLPGHPEPWIPGVVTGSGSLGMGLSKAQGMALAGHKGRIFVLCGDGEVQEGQMFEAISNIGSRGLKNIYLLVDYNKWQCDYTTTRIRQFPLSWSPCICLDGNDLGSVRVVFDDSHKRNGPKIILFDTVKSKGMPWEGTNKYHGGYITDDDYTEAFTGLVGKLPTEHQSVLCETQREGRQLIQDTNILTKDYGELLSNLMAENPDVVCCSADLVADCGLNGLRGEERFFEFGISEQDMVSAAGGMAIMGKIPFVHSFASFLCRRANEQIYANCSDSLHIIYVGFLSGVLPYGPGPSHTSLDDVRLMKTMPGLVVFEPRDREELENCMKWAVYHYGGPVYIKVSCLPVVEGARR